MPDIIICSVSMVSLSVFIIGLGLSVRKHGQAGIIHSMKQVFIGTTGMGVVTLWLAVGNIAPGDKLVLLAVYVVLFWASSFAYIIGIFGLPLTSLRIQILLTIFNSPLHRIDEATLMKKYSLSTMVGQRIYRLETSGEIVRKGKLFCIKSKWSYFVLHNIFLIYLTKLYNPIPRRKVTT